MSEHDKPLSEDEQKEYKSLREKYDGKFEKLRENFSPRQDYNFLKIEEVVIKNKEQACHDGADSSQKLLEAIKHSFGGEPPSEITIKLAREAGCVAGEVSSSFGIRHEKTPEKIEKKTEETIKDVGKNLPKWQQEANEGVKNAFEAFKNFACDVGLYTADKCWTPNTPPPPAEQKGRQH